MIRHLDWNSFDALIAILPSVRNIVIALRSMEAKSHFVRNMERQLTHMRARVEFSYVFWHSGDIYFKGDCDPLESKMLFVSPPAEDGSSECNPYKLLARLTMALQILDPSLERIMQRRSTLLEREMPRIRWT